MTPTDQSFTGALQKRPKAEGIGLSVGEQDVTAARAGGRPAAAAAEGTSGVDRQ